MGKNDLRTSFPHQLCFFNRPLGISSNYFPLDGLYVSRVGKNALEDSDFCIGGYHNFLLFSLSILSGYPIPSRDFWFLMAI